MKKDRNTFFQESQYINNTPFPNQNPNMIPNIPFQMNYNYGMGVIPPNYTTGIPNNETNYSPDYTDLESRLSKLERQINRLDLRLNKLENNSFYSTDDIDNTTNVYMV